MLARNGRGSTIMKSWCIYRLAAMPFQRKETKIAQTTPVSQNCPATTTFSLDKDSFTLSILSHSSKHAVERISARVRETKKQRSFPRSRRKSSQVCRSGHLSQTHSRPPLLFSISQRRSLKSTIQRRSCEKILRRCKLKLSARITSSRRRLKC